MYIYTHSHTHTNTQQQQGDEGDDISHPNAYFIPKKKKVPTHEEIERHFPFQREKFYFRYRTAGQVKGEYVWVDVNDPNENVPMYYGRIFLKALRLESTKNDYDFGEKVDDDDEEEEEDVDDFVMVEEDNDVSVGVKKVKSRLKRRGTTEEMMNFMSTEDEDNTFVDEEEEEDDSDDDDDEEEEEEDEEEEEEEEREKEENLSGVEILLRQAKIEDEHESRQASAIAAKISWLAVADVKSTAVLEIRVSISLENTF